MELLSFVFFSRNGTKFLRMKIKKRKVTRDRRIARASLEKKKKKEYQTILDTMELLADLKVTDVATTSRSIELENRQSAFIIDILVKKKEKKLRSQQ